MSWFRKFSRIRLAILWFLSFKATLQNLRLFLCSITGLKNYFLTLSRSYIKSKAILGSPPVPKVASFQLLNAVFSCRCIIKPKNLSYFSLAAIWVSSRPTSPNLRSLILWVTCDLISLSLKSAIVLCFSGLTVSDLYTWSSRNESYLEKRSFYSASSYFSTSLMKGAKF